MKAYAEQSSQDSQLCTRVCQLRIETTGGGVTHCLISTKKSESKWKRKENDELVGSECPVCVNEEEDTGAAKQRAQASSCWGSGIESNSAEKSGS